MNKQEAQSLAPGQQVMYTGPATALRSTGRYYSVIEINGRFFKHLDDCGNVIDAHTDSYNLSSTPAPKTPSPEVVDAAAKDLGIPTPTPPPKSPESLSRHTLEELQKATGQAMTLALQQGQSMAKDMMNTIQAQLDAIQAHTAQVLKVSVNDKPERDLKTQAVPYLKRMIISAKLGKNIMLVGPAGCGKTTAAEQLADSLGIAFHNLTFTAGASETWLFGRQTPNGFVPGSFWLAYKDGGVFLADEFDAGDANLILSINTAIENGHCFNPICGEAVKRHKDFVMIAACNTFGRGGDASYTGRNRLDAATLRRFAGSQIAVDYNLDIEATICPDKQLRKALQDARQTLNNSNSPEIISTGCIKNAYDLVSNGVAFKDVANSLSLAWPDDLKPIMQKAIKTYTEAKKEAS